MLLTSRLRDVRDAQVDGGNGLTVRRTAVGSLGADDLAAWTALHRAQPGVANPFASPVWVLPWYGRFVPEGRDLLLWVTRRGTLVGVVPLHVQDVGVGPLRPGLRAGLVGSGRWTPLELPPLLAAAGQQRAVVRAAAHATLAAGVTWAELSLGRDVWLLDEALAADLDEPVFSRRQDSRACVVLPLAATWEQTRAGLSRNVKESVRRARNRLAKDGRCVEVVTRAGGDLDEAAVGRLLRLHRARSAFTGSAARHHDAFADPDVLGYVREVLPAAAAAGEASLAELVIEGEPVAAQLVLHPPGGIYFHSSGFLPREWALSPVTALQVGAITDAVDRGDRWVNFSPGPNEAKLRWSNDLAVWDEVAFGPARRGPVALYGVFALAKELRRMRHEVGLHRTGPAA